MSKQRGRLSLTVKLGGSVVVFLPDGEKITLTITKLTRGQAGMTFDAPRDISIVRTEVLQRERKSNGTSEQATSDEVRHQSDEDHTTPDADLRV